jgi:hypothetical protein
MAGLGTELFSLATSFDPAGAMRKADVEYQQYGLQQQAIEQARKDQAEEAQQTGMPGKQDLGAMAKNMLGPQFQLNTPDGNLTSAGLINQTLTTAMSEGKDAKKAKQQANYYRAMGKDEIASQYDQEARRLQTRAQQTIQDAQKQKKEAKDDFFSSLYGANSQVDYDRRLKDAQERSGIAGPQDLPQVWTPDTKEYFLSKMSPEMRTKIEKEQRAEDAARRQERSAELRDQHMIALLRDKAGAGKEEPSSKRMLNALTQTSDALKNVANLEISTTGPMFQQKQFNSLYTAPLSALNQKLSDESSQMLQTRMTGVARGLAALESGGAATGLVGLTDSIEKGTFIPAGASLNVTLDKLGEMRRIVESSAKVMLNDPKVSPERKQLVQDELDIVQKAIPFTQADVDRARKEAKKNPKMSITDFATQKFGGDKQQSVTVGGQTYQRSANMSDQDWSDYKKAVGAQ